MDSQIQETRFISCLETKKPSKVNGVQKRLLGFNLNDSLAYQQITIMFSTGITHNELKSIAIILAYKIGINLDRDAQRHNKVLIKWFDENWSKVSQLLPFIQLRDSNDQCITLAREIPESKQNK